MAFNPELADRIRRVFGDRRDIVEKHMFGGVCFMLRGHMCCGIIQSSLMVRLPSDEADRLADEPHVRPMDFTGRPMRGFLFVEPEGISTPKALRRWIDRCVACAEAKPKKLVKRRRPGPPRPSIQARSRIR